jgi:hypothetical protein
MICEERKDMLLRVLDKKPLKDVIWITQMAMGIFARGQGVANIPMEKHFAKGVFSFYLADMSVVYEEIERRLATISEFSYQVILHEHTWTEWYRDVKGCSKVDAEKELHSRKVHYKLWCDTYEGIRTIDETKRAKFLISVSQLNYPN